MVAIVFFFISFYFFSIIFILCYNCISLFLSSLLFLQFFIIFYLLVDIFLLFYNLSLYSTTFFLLFFFLCSNCLYCFFFSFLSISFCLLSSHYSEKHHGDQITDIGATKVVVRRPNAFLKAKRAENKDMKSDVIIKEDESGFR